MGRAASELGLGGLELAADAVSQIDEQLPLGRQLDTATSPLEDRGPALAFEDGELLRDRRRRVADRPRGAADRAAKGDLTEDPEAADVDHR